MAWVRLEDNFFSHPKVLNAGNEAIGLYVRAMTFSSHHLTDGHVPAAWVRQAAGSRTNKLAAILVEHGLWTVNDSGWIIHDYLEYQPTGEQVRAKRDLISAARSEAGKRGAASKWGRQT